VTNSTISHRSPLFPIGLFFFQGKLVPLEQSDRLETIAHSNSSRQPSRVTKKKKTEPMTERRRGKNRSAKARSLRHVDGVGIRPFSNAAGVVRKSPNKNTLLVAPGKLNLFTEIAEQIDAIVRHVDGTRIRSLWGASLMPRKSLSQYREYTENLQLAYKIY